MRRSILIFILTTVFFAGHAEIVYFDSNSMGFAGDTETKTARLYTLGEGASGEVTIPATVTYNSIEYSVIVGNGGAVTEYSYMGNDGSLQTVKMKITKVNVSEGITNINNFAFSGCTTLTAVSLPSSLKEIGDGAFSDCENLKSIKLPNHITKISSFTFNNNKSLESITFPTGLVEIEDAAFQNCESLTSVNFPEGLTEIGDYAFSVCRNLSSVNFPTSLKNIGTFAFQSCAFQEIELHEGLLSISKGTVEDGYDEGAFTANTYLKSIYIPSSVNFIGDATFADATSMTSMTVSPNNTVYDSRENCNAIIETASNTLIAGCKMTVIPSSVEAIGHDAFFGIEELGSIKFPEGLKSIALYSFCRCKGLTDIDSPSSVNNIEEYAFFNCPDIKSVTARIENPTTIDEETFGISNGWNAEKNDYNYDDIIYETATLYVPAGTIDKYKKTDGWSKFKNIVELTDTGISDINVQENSETLWYSIDGKRIEQPTNGIYIKKQKDGTTRKYLVK